MLVYQRVNSQLFWGGHWPRLFGVWKTPKPPGLAPVLLCAFFTQVLGSRESRERARFAPGLLGADQIPEMGKITKHPLIYIVECRNHVFL